MYMHRERERERERKREREEGRQINRQTNRGRKKERERAPDGNAIGAPALDGDALEVERCTHHHDCSVALHPAFISIQLRGLISIQLGGQKLLCLN